MSRSPHLAAFAIPSRVHALHVLETLAIGAAGGGVFLWVNLPGGLISGAMIAVGIAAIAGRPLRDPFADHPIGAGAARDFAGLAGVAATAATCRLLSPDHRAAGGGNILLDLRQQPLSAALSWLGPDLGVSGGRAGRAVASHHPGRRERRRRAGDRGGADHAGDHPDRRTANAADPDRPRPGNAAAQHDRRSPRRSRWPSWSPARSRSRCCCTGSNFRRAGCSAR